MNYTRGIYKEILLGSLHSRTYRQVENLFYEATTSDKIDEHGNWQFSAEFDKAGRGHATNWSLYGIGRDYFTRRLLIVIQIRQWVKHTRRGYPNVRKSYFLLGRNEDNSAFAHPVESRVVHSAIRSGVDVVRACQNWMFSGNYMRMQRQGDIAMLPISSTAHLRQASSSTGEVTLQESHQLSAREFKRVGDNLYAKNPELRHLPRTHPDIAGQGWWKIIVSRRGRFYDFAVPTVD